MLLDGLRGYGFDVERLRLTGAKDEGDLRIALPGDRYVVIEAKAAKLEPADFVQQAHVEAVNFANRRNVPTENIYGVAVIKRRGKGIKDAYVLTTLADYLGLE